MITLTLNGQSVCISSDTTLAALLTQYAPPTPFAVAVNTTFIPKYHYATHILKSGDSIEIVRPVVGG